MDRIVSGARKDGRGYWTVDDDRVRGAEKAGSPQGEIVRIDARKNDLDHRILGTSLRLLEPAFDRIGRMLLHRVESAARLQRGIEGLAAIACIRESGP